MNSKQHYFHRHAREGDLNNENSETRITSTTIATTTTTRITTTKTTPTPSSLSPSSRGVATHTKVYTTSFPSDADVLLGRGVAGNRHPGNIAFRKLVNSRKALYQSEGKKEKRTVAKSIVQAVKDQEGRFLEKSKHSTNSCWVEIDDEKAIAKACQALREKQRQSRFATSRQRRLHPYNSRKNSVEKPSAIPIPSNQGVEVAFSENTAGREEDGRETVAVTSIPPIVPGWEWKLFDFEEEEQEPTLPYRPQSSSRFEGLCSPMISPKPRLQTSNSLTMLLSFPILSPALCDSGNSRPLSSPVLGPWPIKEQAEEEFANRINTNLYSPVMCDNGISRIVESSVASPVESSVASPVLNPWPTDVQVEEKPTNMSSAMLYSPVSFGNHNLQPTPSPVLIPWPVDAQVGEESIKKFSEMLYPSPFSDDRNLQPVASPVLRPWLMDIQIEEI